MSELRQFARRISVDWRCHSDSFFKIEDDYIRSLPMDRKEALADESRNFLYDSGLVSDEELLRRWFEHGAEAWDVDLIVRPVLADFYWMMRPDAPGFTRVDNQPVGKGIVIVGLVSK